MNPGWLRSTDVFAAAAGVLLVVSLFLPWFGDRSGWAAFTVDDILLTIIGAFGPAIALAAMTLRSPALPVGLAVAGAVLGAVAVIIVVIALLTGDDLGVGAWLGLAGALAVTAGAWRSMADPRNRGVAPVPSELRPAP